MKNFNFNPFFKSQSSEDSRLSQDIKNNNSKPGTKHENHIFTFVICKCDCCKPFLKHALVNFRA
jgi:hypothetical protein